MTAAKGHVFVVRGDLTSLVCDWWLLPSGTAVNGDPGDVGQHFRHDDRVRNAISRPEWRQRAPTNAERAVVLAEPDSGPGIIAVHTGERGSESAEWFADALEAAATVALQHGGRFGPPRPLPLVAFPLLGTGAGGAAGRKGSVLEALLDRADTVASLGVDLVLILANAGAYSAAQRLRSADPHRTRWATSLDTTELALAETLAAHARAGKLVAFIGAGLGQAAGLPGWSDLLVNVGASAGIGQSQVEELKAMDPRDAGDVLQQRLGGPEALDRELRKCFDSATRGSLSHALLASLPLHEAATTNYDRLFETAWGAAISGPGPSARECVTVLPTQDAAHAQHWLLKLHGDVDDPKRKLVLSRDEYSRFEQAGGAVAGVLQAMLLTRHLLIVGYGLRDETFHRIAHEVRDVRASPVQTAMTISGEAGQQLGTALLVTPPGLRHDVWKDDLKIVDLSGGGSADPAIAARRQDLLLDLVGSLAAPVESYVLGPGWQDLSDHGTDAELRTALLPLTKLAPRLDEPIQRSVREVLRRFGWES